LLRLVIFGLQTIRGSGAKPYVTSMEGQLSRVPGRHGIGKAVRND
jgi:hypothetical protein